MNKENNICDSTIISLNNHDNSTSVTCNNIYSSEYTYCYIKNDVIEINLPGKFNGHHFIFKNGNYKYIINAESGKLTVTKNGLIILEKTRKD